MDGSQANKLEGFFSTEVSLTEGTLDEAIELCTELGLSVNDAEIIRTNSTGLVIYNPKNLADRIKGMKNKNISREQKIAARLKYNQQQSQQK